LAACCAAGDKRRDQVTDLNGKVAVVTGSTRGIGRAIAAALLAEGIHTVVSSRSAEDVKRTVGELEPKGPVKVAGLACDVRDHGHVRRLMAFAVERFGGLDILVNNAGIGGHGNVADLDPAAWRAVIDTNLTGVFYCCREAIPLLRARGGGYIINISSLAGINAFPGAAAYNASKFGLNGFSEALFQEVRYDGIRVSYVMPGSVATESRDPARKGWALTSEDVADAVVGLLKTHSRSLTSRLEIRPAQPKKR
jgi:NAD(P)-dependent dehydrogenase (short-subunit alcohol dehydrogenase family)